MTLRFWSPERRMLALEECKLHLLNYDGISERILDEELEWLESLPDDLLIKERNRICYGW